MPELMPKHKEILRKAYLQYQDWTNTAKGKKQIQEFKNKSEVFRQKFSKNNVSKISDSDFKKCWGDSFAGSFISTVGQDEWWKKKYH